jgi:hypothetical protein
MIPAKENSTSHDLSLETYLWYFLPRRIFMKWLHKNMRTYVTLLTELAHQVFESSVIN